MSIDEAIRSLRGEARAIGRAADRLWTDQEVSLVTGQRTPAEAADQAAQVAEIRRRRDRLAAAIDELGATH